MFGTCAEHQGDEQGDPFLPLLLSLGQHRAMVAVQASLLECERFFSFLDDIYVVCAPSRVGEVHLLLQRHLLEQTGIQVHQGKTKIWNTGGLNPPSCRRFNTKSSREPPRSRGVERRSHVGRL